MLHEETNRGTQTDCQVLLRALVLSVNPWQVCQVLTKAVLPLPTWEEKHFTAQKERQEDSSLETSQIPNLGEESVGFLGMLMGMHL